MSFAFLKTLFLSFFLLLCLGTAAQAQTRQENLEFNLDAATGFAGIWSNGTTVWVADSSANKIF